MQGKINDPKIKINSKWQVNINNPNLKQIFCYPYKYMCHLGYKNIHKIKCIKNTNRQKHQPLIKR